MAKPGKGRQASARQVSPPSPAPDAAKVQAEKDRKERGRVLRELADQQKASFVQTTRTQEAEARAQARIKEADDRTKAAEDLVRMSLEDPMGFLEKHGKKMKDIAERVAKGQPVTDAAKEALERAIKAEEGNAALRQELADRDAKANAEREFLQAKLELSKTYEGSKDKTPNLAKLVKKYGDAYLVTEIQGFYRRLQDGKYGAEAAKFANEYTFSEALEVIEVEKAELAAALREEPAGEAPAAPGAPAAPRPSLTTRAASVATDLPPDFKTLSPKEQTKWAKAQYKALKAK